MMISSKKLRISMMKWIYTILIKKSVYSYNFLFVKLYTIITFLLPYYILNSCSTYQADRNRGQPLNRFLVAKRHSVPNDHEATPKNYQNVDYPGRVEDPLGQILRLFLLFWFSNLLH